MYIGIDIGTSGVKVIIVNDREQVLASANHPLKVSRPHLHWNEQHPDQWWNGVVACLDQLHSEHLELFAETRGIGLSGQMLGPVLIDRENKPLRATILWNDGRADKEADTLAEAMPDIYYRTGCRPHPGFVAPKLLWLRMHEPDVISKIDCLLLPKDYIRLKLTGERATEPTDACGTHFMEARTGKWAPDLMDLSGVKNRWLPPVLASTDVGGYLLPTLEGRWGMPKNTTVAMGAGDNMAGSVGVGVGNPGDAVISVGTSAVTIIVEAEYLPMPDKAVFTHPHAVPGTFLSMGVILSATSCLNWAATLTGQNAPDLAQSAKEVWRSGRAMEAPIFLPYINGIRSPHDIPKALGLMLGLDLGTDAAMMGWSVLEGVAFHITESFNAQRAAGIDVKHLQFIGGGSRSRLWGEMISTLTDLPMNLPIGREVGASLGAARLARVAAGDGELIETLCLKPRHEGRVEPNAKMATLLEERFQRFRDVFSRTRSIL